VAAAFRQHLDEEVLRFWTAPRTVDTECGGFLVAEAKRQGIEVWGTFFPSGVYMPAELFGPEAESRRMQFATWALAPAGQGAEAGLREVESQDAARFVAELRPDLHVLQSHYPDWLPASQKPDCARSYEPYIDAVRGSFPGLPLGLQADVASTQPFRREPAWIRTLEETARSLGLALTTHYEFSLRWEVYSAPPRVQSASIEAAGGVLVVFDQRVDPATCAWLEGCDLGGGRRIQGISVDGNLVRLRVAGTPVPGASFRIPLAGVASDPNVRFPLAGKGPGAPNSLPAGTTVSVSVAERAP
jgi:hypothetical protein